MTVQKNITSQPDVINYFKELPFYNTYIEKPHAKGLKNIDLLSKLLFCEESSVVKINRVKVMQWHAKLQYLRKKDLLIQLEASKSIIKDLLDYLFKETKGFKYQVTVKIFLKKYKLKKTEFSWVCFNSTTKTVINDKLDLDKSFQKVLYGTENLINEGSGWIIESIHSQYINILTFRPLLENSYIKLQVEF